MVNKRVSGIIMPNCHSFFKIYLLIITLNNYIYNTTKKKKNKHFNNRHPRLGMRNFSSRVEKIFHSFAALTRGMFFDARRGISYLRAAM